MSRKSDNSVERRAQADRVLKRADRQDPVRVNRDRRNVKRTTKPGKATARKKR